MQEKIPNLKIHKEYLREFWAVHGNRRLVSVKSRDSTLDALRRLGEVKIKYSAKTLATSKHITREHFDSVKNIRRKYVAFKNQPCFACGKPAVIRHHVIWLKNGGRNIKRNICFLCSNCHSDIHPWLKTK